MPKTTSSQSPVTSLPFVKTTKKGRSFWAVPETKNYGKACRRGRQYAIAFARFLAGNQTMVGAYVFPRIIEDMANSNRGTAEHGHVVGFLAGVADLLAIADINGIVSRYEEGGRGRNRPTRLTYASQARP